MYMQRVTIFPKPEHVREIREMLVEEARQRALPQLDAPCLDGREQPRGVTSLAGAESATEVSSESSGTSSTSSSVSPSVMSN